MNCYKIKLTHNANTIWVDIDRNGLHVVSHLAGIRTARPDAAGMQIVMIEQTVNVALRTLRAAEPDAIVSYPVLAEIENLVRTPVEAA